MQAQVSNQNIGKIYDGAEATGKLISTVFQWKTVSALYENWDTIFKMNYKTCDSNFSEKSLINKYLL